MSLYISHNVFSIAVFLSFLLSFLHIILSLPPKYKRAPFLFSFSGFSKRIVLVFFRIFCYILLYCLHFQKGKTDCRKLSLTISYCTSKGEFMSLHASKKSPEEILEEKILLLSFLSGVCFVIVELFYAIYSHSQSTLMDALMLQNLFLSSCFFF